jgi:multidrug efflux pump subunit AcrA (membrane-fusion protein)
MNKKLIVWGLPLVVAGAVALAHVAGVLPPAAAQKVAGVFEKKPAQPKVAAQNHDIAVSVARVQPREFVETLAVSGSLVSREEILIGPEIEGLRVLEILVEEGAQVTRGQVLASSPPRSMRSWHKTTRRSLATPPRPRRRAAPSWKPKLASTKRAMP